MRLSFSTKSTNFCVVILYCVSSLSFVFSWHPVKQNSPLNSSRNATELFRYFIRIILYIYY